MPGWDRRRGRQPEERDPASPFPQRSSQHFGMHFRITEIALSRGLTEQCSHHLHLLRTNPLLSGKDIPVVWAGNLKPDGPTWRWGRKKTPDHHFSLMGLGNQWCGRVTARSPSHSTPWASPALTQRLALCVFNWWEAIEGRGCAWGPWESARAVWVLAALT